jgi:hypothetical protein
LANSKRTFGATLSIDDRAINKAARAALPETGGENVATLVEQWLEQGRKEGAKTGMQKGLQRGLQRGVQRVRPIALDSIRLALELKFGPAGLDLMPTIEAIEDLDRLQGIPRAIQQAATLDDFRAALARL